MGFKLSQEEVYLRVKDFFIQDVELISNYTSKRNNVKLRCNDCGTEWETLAGNILYRCPTGFQCPHCQQGIIDKQNKITVQCTYCGKEIVRTKKQVDKNQTGYFYCSRDHGNKHKNIIRENNGDFDNSKAYRRRAFSNYPPQCAVCHWDEDERILEVHHKNSDRSNNKVENLIILCPTCHRKITLGYYRLDESQGTCLIPV